MTRNLRIGMILTAALAISAFGAAAAQADSQFDIGAAPAWLTASQNAQNKLTVTSASGVTLTTLKCGTWAYHATTSGSQEPEVTFTQPLGNPGECTLGGLEATVTPGTCKYTLTSTPTSQVWNVDLVGCTSTLSITQGTCVLSVPSTSAALPKVTFVSVPATASTKAHVTATLEVKGLSVTGGSGCPANLQVAGNTADLTGTQTIKAYFDTGGTEGAQVSLIAT